MEISVNSEVATVIFEAVLPPKIFLLDFCLNSASVMIVLHVLDNCVLFHLISELFIIILIIMVEFSQCYFD